MNIPTIGGTKGIFEIFVPGVFLLLNIIGIFFVSPLADQNTKDSMMALISNSALGVIIAICFGYLIGILLRLLKVDTPDNLSALWLRLFSGRARKQKGQSTLFATEAFPYIGWVEEACQQYLPPEALQFYKKIWAKRKQAGENKQFINFCKTIISANDERAANEIYAAEALSRYIAGMFYALFFASILLLAVIIFSTNSTGQLLMVAILLAYVLAIIVIIQNFRRIRIKEVEAIFAASYKNRSLFENKQNIKKRKSSLVGKAK